MSEPTEPRALTREEVVKLAAAFPYDMLLRYEKALLAHDAAQRLTIERLERERDEYEARLDKYAHWTPEHTIEQWLADRQRIVDAKHAEADTQLQATLAEQQERIAELEGDFMIVTEQRLKLKAELDAKLDAAIAEQERLTALILAMKSGGGGTQAEGQTVFYRCQREITGGAP